VLNSAALTVFLVKIRVFHIFHLLGKRISTLITTFVYGKQNK